MIRSYLELRNQPTTEDFDAPKTPVGDKIGICIIGIIAIVAIYLRVNLVF